MFTFTPRLFLVVGNPASGKDELIAAVNVIGSLHAEIVPKHTNRKWHADDYNEMICEKIPNPADPFADYIDNPNYDIDNCDIVYENYGSKYGIKTVDIWDGLMRGTMQVLVVSNSKALNQLINAFGKLAVTLYVYSPITRDAYIKSTREKEERTHVENPYYLVDEEYISSRVKRFDMSWNIYVDNFMLFDHVLIFADKQEDLFDQIFRLFRAYERIIV